jgi:hypothetical protein
MGLLAGLKKTIDEVFQLGTQQSMGEAAALRALYEQKNPDAMLPNTLYRVHGGDRGNFVGFAYVCNCSTEYQLLSMTDWTREYECNACHSKFCAYRILGVVDAEGAYLMKQHEIESAIAKLRIRPRLAGKPASPPFIDTWGKDDSSEGSWGGDKAAERIGTDINAGLW